MAPIRIRFRSALLGAAVLFTSIASAGWNVSFNAKKTEFTLSDDAGNWVLTGTVANGADLTIRAPKQGTGDLDLSDFSGPDGEQIVAFYQGSNGTGSSFVTNELTSVKVPATVKSLGSRAFQNCDQLASVDFPGVETIASLAFAGCPSLVSVEFPNAVTVSDQAFRYCSALEEASFPSVVTLPGKGYNETFPPSLKKVTLSENLTKIGPHVFSECKLLETILPAVLPNLTSIDSAAFKNVPCQQFPAMPALTQILCGQGGSFTGCGITEANFPALTDVGSSAFSSCPNLTKVVAPKLVSIGSNAFQYCPKLEELVFSHTLTSISGTTVFKNSPAIVGFEPLFPTNLTTTLTAAAIYNSCALTNGEAVYNFPATPVVPASLCEKPANISKVVFDSDVTSIGNYAFKALRPSAEVFFHGTTVPTLGTQALWYDGEADDKRLVIRIDNPEAVANWRIAVAANADVYQSDYMGKKPDYPGDKTLGIWKLGSVKTPTHDVYAWVVNDAPVSEKSYLVVHGVPAEIGEVSPAYGNNMNIEIGKSFDCIAPVAFDDGRERATLAGFTVSNLNELGQYTFVQDGTGNICHYTQTKDAGDLTWTWRDRQFRILASAEGGGSVDVPDVWIAVGETVTITATPLPGQLFRFWEGDIGDANKRGQSLTLTADQARTVKAVFGSATDAKMHWVYDAKAGQIYDISADERDVNWTFKVTKQGDDLKLGSGNYGWVSGCGELDLRSFYADTGVNLVNVGVCGGNNVTTLPLELTTAIYLPETVTNIATKSFNYITSLKAFSAPGVVSLANDVFYGDSALEGDLSFPQLKTVGIRVFNGCSQITSVSMPSVVSIAGEAYVSVFANCLSLTNIVLGADLETIGGSVFDGLVNVARIEPQSFPKLRSIGVRAFRDVGANVADCVMPTNFPALTEVEEYAFNRAAIRNAFCPVLEVVPPGMFSGSRLENFYGLSVREVNNEAFNAASFTNAVFSHSLTNVISSSNVPGRYPTLGPSLRHIEPLFSTNLVKGVGPWDGLSQWYYGNNALDAVTEMVYDLPNCPEVPASLCENPSNLQHVVFRSDVTAIGAKALHSLPPHAVVEFWGESVPTLGSEALWVTDGGTNDVRAIVKVMNRSAVPAWKAAIGENDEVFRSEYRRKKADYPGSGTIGLLKLGTVTVGKVKHDVYAWVVNANPDGFMILVR